ncbi:MAG: thioredoxin family protein [Candidatus Delongbacteria bacterium]|nr:thioredoxin family protein [Candidatus Delongbacteria bacterium]
MKRTGFTLIMLGFLSLTLSAEWLSFDQGITQAKKKNKPLMVDFYTDWCHWCKVLDQKTFSDKTVKAYLDKYYVTSKILADSKTQSAQYKGKTYKNNELTSAMGITGFPALMFFDAKGDVITRVPGYIPPEEFILILKYINEGHYKNNVSFDDFKKKQKSS